MSSDSADLTAVRPEGVEPPPSDSKSTGAPSGDPSLHPSSRNEPHSTGAQPHGAALNSPEFPDAGHNGGTVGGWDAPTQKRAASARERIERALLSTIGQRWTLKEMAAVGECSQTSASARWREIARRWEGRRQQARPGVFVYWLTGWRAPPKEKPSAAAVWRELLDLRERVEKLEQERRALSEGGGGR